MIFGFKTTKKVVSLTFDDGPDSIHTFQILDILREHQIKATFFVTGKNAEKYPDIIKRMIKEGHGIGNHTYSHKNLIFKSPKFVRNEINKTDLILRKLGVEGKIFFRPPFGRLGLIAIWQLKKLDKKIILWNIPTKDYKAKNVDVILKKIKLKSGGIIVLHDCGKNSHLTIKAIEKIIVKINKEGYYFDTISKLAFPTILKK